jgi:hypothetical protein
MLRLLISSFLAISVAVAQDWQNQGKIDSREVQVERREGNAVVGTEYFHLEYRVSIKIVPDPQAVWDWKSAADCIAVCKGKKHKKHEECDLSCDEICKKKHPISIKGMAIRLEKDRENMTKESGRLAKGFGMPGGPQNWSSATSNALRQLESATKAEKTEFDAGHDPVPCASTTRFYGYNRETVWVKGEFWKVGYYMSRGMKTPIEERLQSHEGKVLDLYHPQRDSIGSWKPAVNCKCTQATGEPPSEPAPGQSVIPTAGRTPTYSGLRPPPVRTPTYSGLGWRKSDGTVVIPDEKKVKVTCTGKDLSNAEIQIENNSGASYEVSIQPGTRLIPDNAGTQTMTCMGNQKATVAAGATTILQVALSPEPILARLAAIPIRVACAEMNKKQPTGDTKFSIVAPSDILLQNICGMEDSGFLRTTTAQVRVWIYTDSASLGEIKKHLATGLSEGMYLNALFSLDQAGEDLTQTRYRKLLDPALLTAPTATREATIWYANFLRDLDPKTSFGKKVLDTIRSGLSTKAEALDARHAAYVVLALSDSDNKEVRTAALELMEKGVPDPLKAEFLAEGGLGALMSMITFGDDAEALRAISVAKLYPGAATKEMLESFGAWGRESIRTAAQEAAKGM